MDVDERIHECQWLIGVNKGEYDRPKESATPLPLLDVWHSQRLIMELKDDRNAHVSLVCYAAFRMSIKTSLKRPYMNRMAMIGDNIFSVLDL